MTHFGYQVYGFGAAASNTQPTNLFPRLSLIPYDSEVVAFITTANVISVFDSITLASYNSTVIQLGNIDITSTFDSLLLASFNTTISIPPPPPSYPLFDLTVGENSFNYGFIEASSLGGISPNLADIGDNVDSILVEVRMSKAGGFGNVIFDHVGGVALDAGASINLHINSSVYNIPLAFVSNDTSYFEFLDGTAIDEINLVLAAEVGNTIQIGLELILPPPLLSTLDSLTITPYDSTVTAATPILLPLNAVAHLIADDIANMTDASDIPIAGSNGNTFAKWFDVGDSAVAEHWYDNDNLLTYQSDINGFPAVDVKSVAISRNSSDVALRISNTDSNNDDVTMFAVVSLQEAGGFSRIVTTAGPSPYGGYMLTPRNDSVAGQLTQATPASGTSSGSYGRGYGGQTGLYVFAGRFNATLYKQWAYDQYGQIDEDDMAVASYANSLSGDSRIGSSLDFPGGGQTNYYLHEMVVYASDLGDDATLEVINTLANKYGISTTLPDNILDGLVSWWDFEEASGTRLDSHGAYDLTEVISTTNSRVGILENGADLSNSALGIDTTGTPFVGTGSFSVAGWFSPDNLATSGDFDYIFRRADANTGTTNQIDWSIIFNGTTNRLEFQFIDGVTVNSFPLSDAGQIIAGRLYFIGVAYDTNSDSIITRINDQSVRLHPYAGTFNSGGDQLAFGHLSPSFPRHPDGMIDSWGYWDRSLNTTEIEKLYNNGFGLNYSQIISEQLPNIKTDMVSWYEFEDDLTDSHGTNDMTVTNFSMAYGDGIKGRSADVDLVQVDVPVAGTGFEGTGSFTWAGWVNMDTAPGGTAMVIARRIPSTGVTSSRDWNIGIDGSAILGFTTRNDIGTDFNVTGPTLSVSTDYFIVATYNSTTNLMQLIVNDGTPVTETLTGTFRTTGTHYGMFDWSTAVVNRPLKGKCDEVGYWGRVLTAEEITALYNDGNAVSYSNIIDLPTYFDNTLDPLNKGTGIELSDNNLTATGTAVNTGLVKSVESVSTGKWVLDVEMDTFTGTGGNAVGVVGISPVAEPSSNYIGEGTGSVGVWHLGGLGLQVYAAGVLVYDPGADQIADGDIIRFVWDADAGKVWVARNGVYVNSGDPANDVGQVVSGANYQGEHFFTTGPRNTGNICKVKSSPVYALPQGFNYFGTNNSTNSENTVLLLRMDGIDEGNTFTDSSYVNATVTRLGPGDTVVNDTDVKLYGVSSARFNQPSGSQYLSVPWNELYNPLSGDDYTIEALVYADSWTSWDSGLNDCPSLIGKQTGINDTQVWTFGINDGNVQFYHFNGAQQRITGSSVLSTGQWHHIAMTIRGSDSAVSLFVNGVQEVSNQVTTISEQPAAVDLVIGAGRSEYMSGWVYEIRMTKGVRRYTGNFSPPTVPLANN